MSTKLYYHKTDGGAEYLCTSPIEGTDEGDLHTALIRLDGEPELLKPSVESELLEALEVTQKYARDHITGFSVREGKEAVRVYNIVRAAIQKVQR